MYTRLLHAYRCLLQLSLAAKAPWLQPKPAMPSSASTRVSTCALLTSAARIPRMSRLVRSIAWLVNLLGQLLRNSRYIKTYKTIWHLFVGAILFFLLFYSHFSVKNLFSIRLLRIMGIQYILYILPKEGNTMLTQKLRKVGN